MVLRAGLPSATRRSTPVPSPSRRRLRQPLARGSPCWSRGPSATALDDTGIIAGRWASWRRLPCSPFAFATRPPAPPLGIPICAPARALGEPDEEGFYQVRSRRCGQCRRSWQVFASIAWPVPTSRPIVAIRRGATIIGARATVWRRAPCRCAQLWWVSSVAAFRRLTWRGRGLHDGGCWASIGVRLRRRQFQVVRLRRGTPSRSQSAMPTLPPPSQAPAPAQANAGEVVADSSAVAFVDGGTEEPAPWRPHVLLVVVPRTAEI